MAFQQVVAPRPPICIFKKFRWEDENKQRIFWITSTLDGETMIKIAESVEAVQ